MAPVPRRSPRFMRSCRFVPLFAALLWGAAAAGQTTVPVFDERDVAGETYYNASAGTATGGSELEQAGPDGTRLPLETANAQSGTVSGRLRYQQVAGGAWTMRVDAPASPALDFSAADSVVLFLNAPMPVGGPELPRFALEDMAGHRTVALPFPFNSHIGYNAQRSGFRPGSTTDAAYTVSYIETGGLPAAQVRPGYPEDLTITFGDVPLDTSIAAIGLPAIPAKFRVDASSGIQLSFRFFDANGDRTLAGAGEYIVILTAAPGSPTLRPTWRVEANANAASPPNAGDVYFLAVDNAGLDGDVLSWQRVRFGLGEFGPLGAFNPAQVRGVVFVGGGTTAAMRTLWFDRVYAVDRGPSPTGPPPPVVNDVRVGDETVVLRWPAASGALSYNVYRSVGPDGPFVRLTQPAVRTLEFADVSAVNGVAYTYVLRSTGAFGVVGPDSAPVSATAAPGGFDPFLDLVEEKAVLYFWNEANPANGMVRDRSQTGSPASIAAVGFGLTAIPIGMERGWIAAADGQTRVLNTLRHFASCPQGPQGTGVCGYKGFFYHFLDMGTGLRSGDTELSTIDSALLFGGVVFVREYFDGTDAGSVEIRTLADSILHRVDWNWAAPRPPRVALGWFPSGGFINADWTGYNEAMILYLLGMGSPTHPLPDGAWTAWTSGYAWGTHYGYSFVEFPPLFGHQYSHTWVDFRGTADAYMRGRGLDYFENSRRATLAQRAYSIDNPANHPNYSAAEWGITASDDPFGYSARGAPPAQNDNGTIAPTAPGGSFAFTPVESREAFRHFYRTYGAALWGPYGFRDAYNIREGWIGDDYIGIDQGPIAAMLENLRTGLVWDRSMQNADLQRGLQRAGFLPFVDAEDGAAPAAVALALAGASPARSHTALRVSLPAATDVRLRVYDLLGREVAVLVDGPRAAGEHVVQVGVEGWASGVYVVRLEAGDVLATVRLVVAR